MIFAYVEGEATSGLGMPMAGQERTKSRRC